MVIGGSPSVMAVKVSTEDMTGTIAQLTDKWNQFSPNQPIRYDFLDESYALMYANVQRTGKLFSSFALLAIIVACLGLFALSTFLVEQRTKEVGIRKVLGASAFQIIQLLSKNFLLLVGVSLILSIPIAWYVMTKWLEDFAYSIQVSGSVFIWAGLIAILIACLTISYQVFQSVTADPVKALRSD